MDFRKQLIKTVLPFAFQNFMLSLVSVSDTIMLGFLEQDAMSAVNLAGQVQFILNMFASGIAIGMGVMAAQYWGKHDAKTIGKVVPIALRLNISVGVVFSCVGLFFPKHVMSLLTDNANIAEIGAEYLRMVALSYILCAISQVYLVLLKNTGHAKASSFIASSAVVVNIVLNYLFIFGIFGIPGMGVRGAAVATICARAVELTIAVLYSARPECVHIKWIRLFDRAGALLSKDFMRYSVPVLGASLVWGFAYSSYSVVIGHLGDDVMAAYSVTCSVKNLVTCFVFGLSGGTSVMLGNLLGAGQLEKAKKWANKLIFISFLFGISITALMMIFSFTLPVILPNHMNLSESAADYLRLTLRITGINIAFMGMNSTILDGVACAGGDSAFDMKGNIIFMWCFGVPLSFLGTFVLQWPVILIYICTCLDEVVKFPFMLRHHFKYVWLKNITRDNTETDGI